MTVVRLTKVGASPAAEPGIFFRATSTIRCMNRTARRRSDSSKTKPLCEFPNPWGRSSIYEFSHVFAGCWLRVEVYIHSCEDPDIPQSRSTAMMMLIKFEGSFFF